MSNKRTMFTLVAFFVVTFVMTIYGPLSIVARADTSSNATMYRSFVSDGLGFYKVRNIEAIPRQFTYDYRVLNINIGDTIIWENDAEENAFTIVSDQNLWNDQIGYVRVGQKINYKFYKSGTYTFYIKEVPSKRQTIVVKDTGEISTAVKTPTVAITSHQTPVPTETYKPSYTVPTPTSTIVPSAPNYTIPVLTQTIPDIEIPIKITPASVASIIVAALSMYIAFRRKN